MLQNDASISSIAKVGFDTAENGPSKNVGYILPTPSPPPWVTNAQRVGTASPAASTVKAEFTCSRPKMRRSLPSSVAIFWQHYAEIKRVELSVWA